VSRRKDGDTIPVELTMSSVRSEGRLAFHLVVNDLSGVRALERQRADAEARLKLLEATAAHSDQERRRAEQELHQARLEVARAELLQRAAAAEHEDRLGDAEAGRRRLERSFDDAPIAMALADSNRQLVRVNAALCELTGVPRERLETSTIEQLAHPEDHELVRAGLRPLLERDRGRWQAEVRLLDARRHELPIDLGLTLLREGEDPPFVLLHAEDLRDRRRAQERVEFLADHDFLTGLPDRPQLERELDRAAASGEHGAVVVLDLDGLRAVNDSLGRPAGDAVVAATARALGERVRRSDALGRIGGDAFAVVLEGAAEADARRIGEELLDSVRRTETPDGRPASASAGVLLFTGSERLSASELLVEAELAVYDAKEAGRDTMVVRQAAGARRGDSGDRAWADRIRTALEQDCFVLHAQPIVSLKGDPADRHELLLRLLGDDGDLIPPATFLYIAERLGLSEAIDAWVIGEAARMLARADSSGRELHLEVNLSASSVADPGLPDLVASELRSAGANGSGLSLAIDEAAAIENVDAVRGLAESIRGLGCELVLDHFGSGLASFHYLQQLAVDYVKIDGSFVKDLPHNRAGRMVIKSVVEVAGSLGCRTIAERVGDAETLGLLQGHGVDYAQGFYLARPRPLAELETSAVRQNVRDLRAP
jgi:diguanylate cyclase (GGDEF)-like protein/PAS domain S-box-containing protein